MAQQAKGEAVEPRPLQEFAESRTGPALPSDTVWPDGSAPQDLAPEHSEAPRPPPREPEGAGEHGTARHRPGLLHRHPFAAAIATVLFALLAAGGYLYWNYAGHFESTDDAFIAARQFAVAPRVAGNITTVPVTDNQHVAAGGLIARIDDRDYRVALEQAQAQVTSAQANIQYIDAQIAVQEAQVAENEAQVAQAQATLVFAQQQATRYASLAQRGAVSVQDNQQSATSLRQQEASLNSARAALEVAGRQIAVLKAQRAVADANLAQASAQRDQAALNLSYTTITAAQPGHIVALSAAVGEYVAAGTSLSMFVPDPIWVTANFKETQIDAMRPGQKVTMRIDAYPERVIDGHVASIQPGSGTAFSLLPAENATGNYVKITQRVPVKIIMDNPPEDVALGPGMSVVPTLRVDPAPSLYERLTAWL